MAELEYVTTSGGRLKAVVVPIEFWQQWFPVEGISAEKIAESIENYCLNAAMDEAQDSPLLNREEALKFLDA